MTFGVATGRVEITPSAIGSADIWTGGWGINHMRATETARPLYARCLVLFDEGVPNVLVTVDVLGLPRSLHQPIRSQVTALGVANSDFMITATHTHQGPVLDDRLDPYVAYDLDPNTEIPIVHEYTSWLQDTIVGLVRTVLASAPQDCQLEYGLDSTDIATNRRGLRWVDYAVPVLLARSTADPRRLVAVIFGYACHPIEAGRAQTYDSDYPGVAAARIEATYPGCTAFFLLGAAGDQNPRLWGMTAFVPDIGASVYRALLRVTRAGGRVLANPINTQYQELRLPFDFQISQSVMSGKYSARLDGGASPQGRHAQEMINQINAGTLPTVMPLPVQMWKFGGTQPLRLAAVGGELTCGYSVLFKNDLGGSANLWVAAFANECPCYIPSDELMTLGGYEPGWEASDPTIAGIGDAIMYYGWPCRLLARDSAANANVTGIEQLVTSAVLRMAAS